MAAPTDVRVEAESQSTVRLRWTYGGTNSMAVYRSTDGSSYSEVTSTADSTRVQSGTTEYEDTGLSATTKYWYKLSDDSGSTFSSVVTVYSHACASTDSSKAGDVMPRVADEVTPDAFNELSEKVENGLIRFNSPEGKTCVACINDGALVIDCVDYDHCESIEVEVDQDINSISLPDCNDTETDINFIIPPNTTRRIGGWPRGIGFTGDEGFQAPIRGGTSGRIVNELISKGFNINSRSGKSKSGNGTSGTSAGGANRTSGAGCTCTPAADGGMRIVACNPDGTRNPNNSLNCSAATKGAKLIVCGGRGPYSWTFGGSLNGVGNDAGKATILPPTNNGTGVAGDAYWMLKATCAPGTATVDVAKDIYSCADVKTATCQSAGTGPFSCPSASITCASLPKCRGTNAEPGNCNCGGGSFPGTTGVGACSYCDASSGGTVCDKRTGTMVSNGCNPCGVQAGSTVTVTDAMGTQVTIIMKA